MAKDICSDCGGPREANSPSYSYCIECNKRRARERYARMRAEAGFEVRSTHEDTTETRRRYIVTSQGRPGKCEACQEYEPNALALIRVGDPNNEQHLYGDGEQRALWCQNCRSLSKLLTDDILNRAVRLANYLRQSHLTLAAVLPDLQDVIMGTIPTPIATATDK